MENQEITQTSANVAKKTTPKINITITPKKSVLNNILCKEPIDIDILDKLLSSDLLRENFHNPFAEYNNSNELEQLTKYKALIDKEGHANVRYNKVNGMDYGRVNPIGALGLFPIRREIRQTLSKIKLIDIDIENAHPVMLLQICEQNNIEHTHLKKYVNSRSKYLEQLQKAYLASIDDKNKLKDVSKNLFIRLLYLGKIDGWFKDNNFELKDTKENHSTNKFIFGFEKEMEEIAQKICDKNPLLVELVKKRKNDQNKKKYNLNGAVMSYFLQEYECQILESMYKYCVKHKYIVNNVCVLCADGFMILKDKFKIELLQELEQEVLIKTGFKIRLTQKEMTQDYLDILDDHIIESDKDDNSYLSHKKQFEKHSFKVMTPLMYATEELEQLTLINRNEFKNKYENIICDMVVKTKNGYQIKDGQFINDWFKDPDNRTYDRIDFLPRQITPQGVYNTFKGFKIDKVVKTKDIDITTTLIYKHFMNLCNNEEPVINYVSKWLARKVQKPYKLTNTAILFRSIEGCGKDTFFDWFGHEILGKQYYINEDKIEDIFGKFNPAIENKIIVVVNETNGKDTKDVESSIKNALTRKINSIQYKGKTQFDNTNNIGYVFFSNQENPIKIDINDRRFQAIQCNNEIANNREYFKALRKEIEGDEKDDIAKAFYDYLMGIECDDYDFTGERVKTEFYNDMKEHNIPVLIKFLESEIISSVYKDKISKQIKLKEKGVYRASSLFELFNEYIKRNNYNYQTTSTKFGLEIKKFESIEKKQTNMGAKYIINYPALKDFLVEKTYIKWDNNIEVEEVKEIKEDDPLD
jgi:hypothetical protein